MGNFMQQHAGSVGSAVGTGVGAAAGSVVPGLGTAAGAGIGGSLGGSAGAMLGGKGVQNMAAQQPVDPIGSQHMATLQLLHSLLQAVAAEQQQQSPSGGQLPINMQPPAGYKQGMTL